MVYPVVLRAEEEQRIFTQWLTAGREFNALASKDPNFLSSWCNDDMVFNAEGKISDAPVFQPAEKPEDD